MRPDTLLYQLFLPSPNVPFIGRGAGGEVFVPFSIRGTNTQHLNNSENVIPRIPRGKFLWMFPPILGTCSVEQIPNKEPALWQPAASRSGPSAARPLPHPFTQKQPWGYRVQPG
jgi:hypothetical protein